MEELRRCQEVLSEFGKLVEYVKRSSVITMLPSALHDISSSDAGEVAKWQKQIARVRQRAPMGAIACFWLDLLDEMFRGARDRLQELHARATKVPPPLVPEKCKTFRSMA